MVKALVRQTVHRADKMGLRRPIARFASLAMTITGRPQRFSVDAAGDWVNTQPEATFVSPDILASRYSAKQAEIRDLWCHQYTPEPGDTVVDIGAGIGDEALIFSRMVGASGRVITVEAHPRVFGRLIKTIERSALTNVTPVQAALADQPGTLTIGDDETDHIANSVLLAKGGVAVPAITLDMLAADQHLSRIALLKMNIEGAERLALRGMDAARAVCAHLAISCHDFVADRDGPAYDALRTRQDILDLVSGWGFDVTQRPDDPRPWVRDYIYAKNPALN